MASVWVIGSLNIDLVSRVDRFPVAGETVAGAGLRRLPGGKGANQAVAAAAAGAAVRMIGRVGDDAAGSEYLTSIAQRGVDVSGVTIEPDYPTGHALVLLDQQGENCIVVIAGANGRVGLGDVTRFDPAADDVLLLQLEVPTDVIAAAVAVSGAAGATVLLNLSPYQELDRDLVQACDVIVVNEHEAAQLTASGIEAKSVVITRGAAGASWDGETARCEAAEVIDTTGAGDAFAGALAAALARGEDHRGALQAAVRAGAAAVSRLGTQGWAF